MAFITEDSKPEENYIFETINLAFTILFGVEAISKIIGNGISGVLL